MWHVTLRFVSERMLVNVEMIVEHEVEDILSQVRKTVSLWQNADVHVWKPVYIPGMW